MFFKAVFFNNQIDRSKTAQVSVRINYHQVESIGRNREDGSVCRLYPLKRWRGMRVHPVGRVRETNWIFLILIE